MSDHAVEILITNAIHTAFIKYPEGDGGPNLDYEWIVPDQSINIAKAILQDLAANGIAQDVTADLARATSRQKAVTLTNNGEPRLNRSNNFCFVRTVK